MVDGNKASKCNLRKIFLQKCVCAAFSVLVFVKTWRFFFPDFISGMWGYLHSDAIGSPSYPFGIWWMLLFFCCCFSRQQCVCWSWSDRRAARPQRATSGGRWPINVDLFTMVGLTAWWHSFFPPFLFSSLSTQHINHALWNQVQWVFTVVMVLDVFDGYHTNRTRCVLLV